MEVYLLSCEPSQKWTQQWNASSGMRINYAKDDAAGTISTRLTAEVQGLQMALARR